MKTKIIVISIVSVLAFFSCRRTPVPEGYLEYQGQNYKKPNEVTYDANGDGIISEGETIGVLGSNLDVSEAPSGKPFYQGSSSNGSGSGSGSGSGDGSGNGSNSGNGSGSGTLVPTGEKLCYLDVQHNCDKYGALYSYETTMNGSEEDIISHSKEQSLDNDFNGVVDYIDDLRETENTDELSKAHSSIAATEAEKLLEEISGKNIGGYAIKIAIEESVKKALNTVLFANDDFVSLEDVKQEINVFVTQAIIEVAKDFEELKDITPSELANVAFKVAAYVAENVTNDLAEQVAKGIIEQYNKVSANQENSKFQGICPDGYHIPSDAEWMIFELALGMSTQDLTKSGENVTDRGADVGVASKMISDHGFKYSGYASINGTYSQLDEAGVFWSSTAGKDANGSYVWVRQIDKSYGGVVRYKHYNKSGLSIRCFKD